MKRQDKVGPILLKAIISQTSLLVVTFAMSSLSSTFCCSAIAENSDWQDRERRQNLNADQAKELDQSLRALHQAHVVAETPQGIFFDRQLQRDLNAHFSSLFRRKVKICYEPLQKEGIQIGVGFPYYYIWVTVDDATTGHLLDKGMLAAKAVNKSEFVIGKLIRADRLCSKDFRFPEFFPASLCAAALARARAARRAVTSEAVDAAIWKMHK